MKPSPCKVFALFMVACASPQAVAGSTTLSNLLAGGTLASDNGMLNFSNFAYYNDLNGPAASNIIVNTTVDGLRFTSPLFSFTAPIDFNLQYTVTAIDFCYIDSASMKSTGSGIGGGYVAVFEVVETQSGTGVANLMNAYANGLTISNQTKYFSPESALNIRTDVAINPGGQGAAGISDITQSFGTYCETPTGTSVPTPSAAMTGLALLSGFMIRRRRNA